MKNFSYKKAFSLPVVEHLAYNPMKECSNPAADTRREKMVKK
jgi:hypothetical protein